MNPSASVSGSVLSLPSRERGLKCKRESNWHDCGWSLPSRERGLKYNGGRVHNGCIGVAPLAGAWIEIPTTTRTCRKRWRSLPSRERGLKSIVSNMFRLCLLSLPSRERGLKSLPAYHNRQSFRRSPRGSVD